MTTKVRDDATPLESPGPLVDNSKPQKALIQLHESSIHRSKSSQDLKDRIAKYICNLGGQVA